MTPARCPQCSAAVPAGAPWCTLCFADLRPAPPAVVAVPVGASAAAPLTSFRAQTAPDPLTAPLSELVGAGAVDEAVVPSRPVLPCATCGERVDVLAGRCAHCGTDLLATLSTGSDGLRVFGRFDVTKMSRSARLGFGAALGVGVMIMLLIVITLIGLLVHS